LIEYRRASAPDAPLIHALLEENAVNDGGTLAGTVDSLLRHGFGAQPLFRAVLAFDDQPLGLSLFFAEYSSWRGAMGVYVQDLYLRPAARGKGIGRGLLTASIAEAADWQPQFLTLMVQRKNLNARAFYAALGFGPRDPSDQLILEGEGLAALTTR
jgi:GNAT superfamily N-acetyltransferase